MNRHNEKMFLYNVVFRGVTTKPNFPNTAVKFKIKSREMESNKENTTVQVKISLVYLNEATVELNSIQSREEASAGSVR